MIKFAFAFLFILPIGIYNSAIAQSVSEKRTVFVDITSFTDAQVSFSWDNFSVDSTYIFRKELSDNKWTRLDSTIGKTYTDNTITTNKEYEYKFQVKTQTWPGSAYGYVVFGAKVNQKNSRGTILVVLDNRFTSSLHNEFKTLQLDLISDGWKPILITCDSSKTHNFLKYKIDSINAISTLNGVILVGHLPVPYSGNSYIDGHPDHKGAWPTDLYYVTDSTLWTDNTVNYTNTTRPANTNVPSDGKYDNTVLPESIFAPISRIDFANLPLLIDSETDLLRNYLIELSKYKQGKINVVKKGVVENNFLNFQEGFAYNGYMNFTSLLGSSKVLTADVLSSLTDSIYQWSYTCGGGTDTSANGVFSISQLRTAAYKGIFSMLFGSYFGDWNTNNNLLRAYLGNGKMLATCWAGRPSWFYHHMGQNNYLGLSATRSINNYRTNSTPYDSVGFGENWVHMSLLGDLSLRNRYSPLVQNFTADYNGTSGKMTLNWSAYTAKNVTSYDIYVANDTLGPYTLLNSSSASDVEYNYYPTPDTLFYFIKAIFLDTSGNGSYYNNSSGTFISINASAASSNSIPLPLELLSFKARLDGENGLLNWVTAQELNFSHFEVEKSLDIYNWQRIGFVAGQNKNSIEKYQFLDENIASCVNYYRLKMIDMDNTYEYSNTVAVDNNLISYLVYPNPTTDGKIYFKSRFKELEVSAADILVTDVFGNTIDFELDEALNSITINGASGVYQLLLLGKYQRVVIVN